MASAGTGGARLETAFDVLQREAATGNSWLYVLDCDHGVKIGISSQSITTRINDLERATGMALHGRLVRVYTFKKRDTAYRVEQMAHWYLRDARTRGEWFHCHPLEATHIIDRIRAGHLTYLDYLRGLDAERDAA